MTHDTPTPAAAPAPAPAAAPRGAIGALVIELLGTDAPYASIVAQVKERFPEARTTAHSVASVAADLRRQGVALPERRRPAPEGLVERIKAWALANYERSYGASALVECFSDEELAEQFTSLADAKDWARLQSEACQNARCDM